MKHAHFTSISQYSQDSIVLQPLLASNSGCPYFSIRSVGVTDMCCRSNLEISWLVSGNWIKTNDKNAVTFFVLFLMSFKYTLLFICSRFCSLQYLAAVHSLHTILFCSQSFAIIRLLSWPWLLVLHCAPLDVTSEHVARSLALGYSGI